MDARKLTQRELANEIVRITRRLDRKTYDFIQRKGNNYVVGVNHLSIQEKTKLATMINDFMQNRKEPISKLKQKRNQLLLTMLEKIRK